MDYCGREVGIHSKSTEYDMNTSNIVENRTGPSFLGRLQIRASPRKRNRVQVWFGFTCPHTRLHGKRRCHRAVPTTVHTLTINCTLGTRTTSNVCRISHQHRSSNRDTSHILRKQKFTFTLHLIRLGSPDPKAQDKLGSSPCLPSPPSREFRSV